MFFGGFLFYNSIVFKISSGFWVYLLTLFLLFLFGFFLVFRFKNPTINNNDLLDLSSSFATNQKDPFFLHIIGGIPASNENIQVNILCSNGKTSPNYLQFSALPNSNILDALEIVSSINNFSFKIDDQKQIESMGDVKNTKNQNWHIYLNSSNVSQSLDKTTLKIGDVLEFKYE